MRAAQMDGASDFQHVLILSDDSVSSCGISQTLSIPYPSSLFSAQRKNCSPCPKRTDTRTDTKLPDSRSSRSFVKPIDVAHHWSSVERGPSQIQHSHEEER